VTSQLYQLVVRRGPRPGQIIPLELDLLTVGRDPLSDIVIEDPEVSRHHASFTQSDEGFLLKDKGSTNGSFVDGERLGGEPVQLKPGQVIMFGSTVTLVYQATSMSDPLATMVAPAVAVGMDEPSPPALDEAPVEVPELEPSPPLEVVDPVVEDPIEEVEAMPSFEVVDPILEDPFADLEPQPESDAEVEAVEEFTPSEAVTDDIVEEAADVVAFDVPESQPSLEEDDDAMATMVEDSPVIPVQEPVEPEPLPTFDQPEPEVVPPSLPTYDEPEPEVELPSQPPPLAPLPSFEEPAPEPAFESPSFALEQEDKGAAFDSGAPIPDFGAEPVDSTPIQTSGEIVKDKAPNNRNRNIIIGVAAFLILCCLCIGLFGVIFTVGQPF
jgi:pSer/pThr/pTyr-binding forkhead associated (FHA) protein